MKSMLATLCVLTTLSATGSLYHHRARGAEDTYAAALQDGPALPRTFYGRRLEPAANTVLHGAGQTDWQSFTRYRAAVAPAAPALFMTYTDLRDDLPAFFAVLQGTLQSEPTVMPQIGLSLNRGDRHTHYESETAAGRDDRALEQLCSGLRELNRPVFLRPGYEFNGTWNGYAPTTYVAAFRRVAARVHSCAPNTAVVWNWSADAELDAEAAGNTAPAASRWQPWYPGDDAVDWWALNLFTAAGIHSAATAQFLQAAALSRHPVMVAESSPRGYNLRTSATAWQDWFQPYFALVHRAPGIRALSYINWNWAGYPQWADWGDGRIETASATLQSHLRSELAQPLYTDANRDAGAVAQLRQVPRQPSESGLRSAAISARSR